MTTDANQPLLERCLFCGYLLEGLPVEHVCPECGRAFDRRWRVFNGARDPQVGNEAGVVVFFGFLTLLCLVSMASWRPIIDFLPALVVGVPVSAFFWVLCMIRLSREWVSIVAVGPKGVAVMKPPGMGARNYDWTEVRRVRRRFLRDVTLDLRDVSLGFGERKVQCHFLSARMAADCARCINSYPRPEPSAPANQEPGCQVGESHAPGELLERCPFCDYSLETMPVEHVCPECGQPFDRRWRVFGGKSGWEAMTTGRRIAEMLALGALGLVCAFQSWQFPIGIVRPSGWDLLLMIGWGILIGWEVWDWLRRPRRFVAVGAEEIVLGDRKRGELRKYRWSGVRDVYAYRPGRVCVRLKEGEVIWSLGGYGYADACRCEEYVNEHFELPG